MRLLHLAHIAHDRLQWVHSRARTRAFELRHGDELAATLVFRSVLGSLATAESADGAWTFKRVGFWRPRVTVRADGSDSNLAVFENATWSGGGTLDLPGGRTLRATTSFWRSRLEFQDGDVPLIRYETDPLRLEADVTILPEAVRMPELPWLVALGWYLIVTMREDAGAVVAVTAAAAAG